MQSSLCIHYVPAAFCLNRVLTNFSKFTEDAQLPEVLFNQVAELQLVTLFKIRLRNRCFPVDLANFSKMSTLQNTSGSLSLCFVSFSVILVKKNFQNHSPVLQKQIAVNSVSKSFGCCNRYQYTRQAKKNLPKILSRITKINEKF